MGGLWRRARRICVKRGGWPGGRFRGARAAGLASRATSGSCGFVRVRRAGRSFGPALVPRDSPTVWFRWLRAAHCYFARPFITGALVKIAGNRVSATEICWTLIGWPSWFCVFFAWNIGVKWKNGLRRRKFRDVEPSILNLIVMLKYGRFCGGIYRKVSAPWRIGFSGLINWFGFVVVMWCHCGSARA